MSLEVCNVLLGMVILLAATVYLRACRLLSFMFQVSVRGGGVRGCERVWECECEGCRGVSGDRIKISSCIN